MRNPNFLQKFSLIVATLLSLAACGGGSETNTSNNNPGNNNNSNNSGPLRFTSPSTTTVAENISGSVFAPSIQGEQAQSVFYSLRDTADSDLFTINPQTGAISFREIPDFEAPQDADQNNQYQLTVVATDASANSIQQSLVITVQDQARTLQANIFFPTPNANFAGSAANTSVTGELVDLEGGPVTSDDFALLRVNGLPVAAANSHTWQVNVPLAQNGETRINAVVNNSNNVALTKTVTVNNQLKPQYTRLALDEANNRVFSVSADLDAVLETNLATGAVRIVSGHATGEGFPLLDLVETAIAYDPDFGIFVYDDTSI